MSKQPTIVITGANGFLGTHLVNHFSNKGWHVRGLVRNAAKCSPTDRISYYEYDLEKPVNDAAFVNADYLVHTAFIKYDRKHPDALERNVQAVERLLASSRKHGLRHNVFISSMSSHEDAVSVYGRQKLAAEKLFNTHNDVSIRSGLIMGDGGIVKQMSEFMRSKHVVPLIDNGKQPLQVIAVGDLVMAIEAALLKKVNGVLTVATPEVYTYKQFYQQLAASMHTAALFVPVPFWLILGAMRAIALLRLPLAVNEDNLWGLKKLRSAETATDLAKLGVELKSLPEILSDMRVA